MSNNNSIIVYVKGFSQHFRGSDIEGSISKSKYISMEISIYLEGKSRPLGAYVKECVGLVKGKEEICDLLKSRYGADKVVFTDAQYETYKKLCLISFYADCLE